MQQGGYGNRDAISAAEDFSRRGAYRRGVARATRFAHAMELPSRTPMRLQ